MGAGTDTMFGDADASHPALPGTYGVPPRGHRLPDGTRVGPVRLQVANLEQSVEWYERVLGLHVAGQAGRTAALAPHGDSRVLVSLEERRGARPAGRTPRLGLYHFAILLPTRAALGRFVRHLAQLGERAGAADHLVSEAFYLHDPDGLGIEVYADRPRAEWRRVGRELMMATDPLDVHDLIRRAGDEPWTGMPPGTVMGHVHLHVGDLQAASEFYSEALGLDRMVARYPGALFLAAGGYHHHLGTNTWAGPSARPAGPDDAKLLEWTLELPTVADVERVADSLDSGGQAVEQTARGYLLARDPWGTAVGIRSADGTV